MSMELESMTMEEAYEKLDELLNSLESGEYTLEETFTMYSQGVKLVQICHDRIDRIEKKLQILEETGGMME